MTSTFYSRCFGGKRAAFTLVELLIVIVIIGMLAGMLLPAINYAREAARRAQCINNQKNIGIAFISYANSNKGLPGYLNQLGKYSDGTARTFSWVVAILPELEENKRYEILTADTNPGASNSAIQSSPPVLICTSAHLEQRAGNPILSYVVNCGPEANSGTSINGDVTPKFTLFKDRRGSLTTINKKVTLDDIADGTSNTVLLSENLQALTWYYPSDANADELPTTAGVTTRLKAAVASLGFVWSNKPSNATFHSRINEDRDGQMDIAHARPSSKHPGIAVMLCGDGSAKPMSDDVGFGPYLSAVCPDDAKAVKAVTDGGLGYSDIDFTKETW